MSMDSSGAKPHILESPSMNYFTAPLLRCWPPSENHMGTAMTEFIFSYTGSYQPRLLFASTAHLCYTIHHNSGDSSLSALVISAGQVIDCTLRLAAYNGNQPGVVLCRCSCLMKTHAQLKPTVWLTDYF